MTWDDDLLPEQRTAASHAGTHARLLAGPGTGKTRVLTRRICYLVEEEDLNPEEILVLTFTRAAAYELRGRVRDELSTEDIPRISTLHSYALRQLLLNSSNLNTLPQPLRIADDWEERNIILEDIKSLLELEHINNARELLSALSADWQSLTADEINWDRRFPSPAFLGAWQEHRSRYGYLLRAELVYQLKRALEQQAAFELEGPPAHLLVDEYQDLNRCDLALVEGIRECGAEVYVAGDDDQSIYGFRMAHPEGIRRFPIDYPGAQDLPLEICMRCDPNILELGLFIARQDYRRVEKNIEAHEDREGGEVALLRFADGNQEAEGVAQLCRYLVEENGVNPEQILILLRSDRNGLVSTPIVHALQEANISVASDYGEANALNRSQGRQVLAILRLLHNREDHLAWRTLIDLRANGIGAGAKTALYDLARSEGLVFSQALQAVADDPSQLPRFGMRVSREVQSINRFLEELLGVFGEIEFDSEDQLSSFIERIVENQVPDDDETEAVFGEISRVITTSGAMSLDDLLRSVEISNENMEQELDETSVNIMTMHKAKGLTADATIIVAAEDEYIPGRAQGDGEGDERRLLYVSLTRARHHLYITFCSRRLGQQRHTGRNSGTAARNLTRFLRDSPQGIEDGNQFISSLFDCTC